MLLFQRRAHPPLSIALPLQETSSSNCKRKKERELCGGSTWNSREEQYCVDER